MITRVESCQSWAENVTHQMNNMVRPVHSLGGDGVRNVSVYRRTGNKLGNWQGELYCGVCRSDLCTEGVGHGV